MKITKKEKEIKKEQNEQNACENKKERLQKIVFRIMCALFCVLIAVAFCSFQALVDSGMFDDKPREFGDMEAFQTNKIKIYIDQGHNPAPHHNTGAEGNGLYEQDLTFSIGCRLAELLEDDGRFEVCLSRPEATTVLGTNNSTSLGARVDGAVEFEADYFLSLHINSHTSDTANGIEVFVLGNDSEANALARSVLHGMVESTNLKNRGVKKSSELFVLKNAHMPAVLLEMGFISNSADAELLSEQPELFADGIYNGILDYCESAYTASISVWLWVMGASLVLAAVLLVFIIMAVKKKSAVLKKHLEDWRYQIFE